MPKRETFDDWLIKNAEKVSTWDRHMLVRAVWEASSRPLEEELREVRGKLSVRTAQVSHIEENALELCGVVTVGMKERGIRMTDHSKVWRCRCETDGDGDGTLVVSHQGLMLAAERAAKQEAALQLLVKKRTVDPEFLKLEEARHELSQSRDKINFGPVLELLKRLHEEYPPPTYPGAFHPSRHSITMDGKDAIISLHLPTGMVFTVTVSADESVSPDEAIESIRKVLWVNKNQEKQ